MSAILMRSQYFNSLWPSDDKWQHRSGSILAQVMADILMVPSHYLKQCWITIIISKVQRHSSQSKVTSAEWTSSVTLDYTFKITIAYTRGQWVKSPQPLTLTSNATSHWRPKSQSTQNFHQVNSITTSQVGHLFCPNNRQLVTGDWLPTFAHSSQVVASPPWISPAQM